MALQGQQRTNTSAAEQDHSSSNPGPENRPLLNQNPSSNMPPPTDRGDLGAIWYSFDLAHKRIQQGGWTRQVTQRELPSSKDLAGVNMRLTAGSVRELHWHTADEWAIMLAGDARVTVLNPDGTVFIDDLTKGDLWYFPVGYPHSIQGLGPDGCEFLLVFDDGMFSEDSTFLLSEWVAHVQGAGVRRRVLEQLDPPSPSGIGRIPPGYGCRGDPVHSPGEDGIHRVNPEYRKRDAGRIGPGVHKGGSVGCHARLWRCGHADGIPSDVSSNAVSWESWRGTSPGCRLSCQKARDVGRVVPAKP
jgi:quercetin dioxygenase-like cupin family protein